jgi:2-polyprenyl-3-methyl-5-hydroxy-6-metoxy-1,4-benzoquinol methylase/uncharacterized protein YbaR (Trm112 family)
MSAFAIWNERRRTVRSPDQFYCKATTFDTHPVAHRCPDAAGALRTPIHVDATIGTVSLPVSDGPRISPHTDVNVWPARLGSALKELAALLRCPACGGKVAITERCDTASYPDLGPDGMLACDSCGSRYPIIGGTARMLDRAGLAALGGRYTAARHLLPTERSVESGIKQRTAESFAYEWSHFGQLRSEWERNFADYLRPHSPSDLAGRLVLDVGSGSGRHSAQAARAGAKVVAVDLGSSIDVTRRNVPEEVLTVQADAEGLPFARDTFDFVMSIGVLHHLSDPEAALRRIVPYTRPGGHVHIYLYWQPPVRWHRIALSGVTLVRRITTRLSHWVLHVLCYPIAAVLMVVFVGPYRWLRRRPRGRRVAAQLPLKTYADYPFGVLVNDQFDRLSAPIEHRYTRAQVASMLSRAGLTDITVLANSGWVGDGRREPVDA